MAWCNGDPTAAALSTLGSGQYQPRTDQIDEAEKKYRRALELTESLGDKHEENQVLTSLAGLEIPKDPKYRHPFYWAPFVLIRTDEPIVTTRP